MSSRVEPQVGFELRTSGRTGSVACTQPTHTIASVIRLSGLSQIHKEENLSGEEGMGTIRGVCRGGLCLCINVVSAPSTVHHKDAQRLAEARGYKG